MYRCNHGSPHGFLEHLPGLLTEVKVEGEKSGMGVGGEDGGAVRGVCGSD
jgi:hypothetical protein